MKGNYMTRKNATDYTAEPLTQEELSTFFNIVTSNGQGSSTNIKEYFNQTVLPKLDERNMLLTSLTQSIRDLTEAVIPFGNLFSQSINKVTETMDQANESHRKYLFKIGNQIVDALTTQQAAEPSDIVDTRFTNSLSEEESIKWINDVWRTCRLIGKRIGKDKKTVLFDVNKIIKDNGVDIYALYTSYKAKNPTRSMISMCGHSDYFRPLVEAELKKMCVKYFPEKYTLKDMTQSTSGKISTAITMKCPEEIRSIISRYAKKNRMTESEALAKLYSDFKLKTGLNMGEEKRKYSASINAVKCGTGYYIAHNQKYFDIFKGIAGEA